LRLNFSQLIFSKIYNIKCVLKNTQFVSGDNLKCLGWFDENDSLVVAMNNSDSLETLVHEYGHLTQFVENNKIWQDGNKSILYVTEWLNGNYVRNVNSHLDNVKYLELDNEKRSVEIIKYFNLKINIPNYIKKANSYIHLHNWLKETRRWPNPKNAPYNNDSILKLMSPKFNMNYKKLSIKLHKAFEKENI
jgi:hypothetical protein